MIILREKYYGILDAFPERHLETLHKIQGYLTDDQLSNVLSCSHCHTANKMMLDYLINNIKSKDNWLDLCNHLNKLADMPDLSHGLRDMREGKIIYINDALSICMLDIYIY